LLFLLLFSSVAVTVAANAGFVVKIKEEVQNLQGPI